jgi:putative spermidine/putrescine transport system substrate-binding protein
VPTLLRIAAVLVLLTGPALAETTTLTVAGYAGSFETSLRAEVLPLFEKRHGVRVDYLSGNSSETLARLKGTPPDVVVADDWAIAQAIRSGFCGPIDDLSASGLQPAARFADDRAVALGLAGTGIAYSTKFFSDKGWPAPQSWNDLKDAKYRKLIALPPIANPYGLEALVMLARANGGGEQDIEPGFTALRERVGANVASYETSLDRMAELFVAGTAPVLVWGSGRAQYFANTSNSPMGFVYPKEGTPLATAAACPTARPAAHSLASAFVKALLEPGIQRLFFRDYGYAPAIRNVELPTDKATIAPTGDRAGSLIQLDWNRIDAHRDQWIARWRREIGQ